VHQYPTRRSAALRIADALGGFSAWPGRAAAWLNPLIAVCVLVSLVASLARANTLLDWSGDWPILGEALTVNSLVDLQWSALAIMTMLAGAYALREEAHVRVDILYGKMSTRRRAWINLLGHLFLLTPFCALMFWHSLGFVERAWNTGEGSSYGGLQDYWLVKACIPLGIALLQLGALAQMLSYVVHLLGGPAPGAPKPETAS